MKVFWNAIANFFKSIFEPQEPSENGTPEIPRVVVDAEREKPTPLVTKPDPVLFMGSQRNEKRLWYPPAVQFPKRMKKVWEHPDGYTRGLILHFNAGRHNPLNTIEGGIKNGYMYDGMGPDGVLHQPNPLNEAGYHCGSGKWTSPSGKVYTPMHRWCRGVEISSAGLLDKNGKSWFGVVIPEEKIREVKRGGSIRESGKYEKYTPAQEVGIINYCLWLKWNNEAVFDFDWVVGHEEISTSKNDPGGSLSVDMATFRKMLKERYEQLISEK